MAKVHLIGNAHLDPVWMWRQPEGYSEVLATFRSALDRMNEFEDYIFTCAGAAYYTWIEETDPDMFDEIRRRVQEGRWVIVGGWWIQPDCNLPSGESFARHALYSQRFFMEKLGKKAETGYNVDSFGHNAMLPQLLVLGGLKNYVYMRPDAGREMQYPFSGESFIWQSPDGTRVPTYHIPLGYASASAEEAVAKSRDTLSLSENGMLPEMCFYGVGNHGGGPTRKMLEALEDLISRSAPDDYAYSSPNQFFNELLNRPLPVFSGDLHHHASGCYSAVMEIKQLNRQAEYSLQAAEKYAALANWLGFKLDTSLLTEAWKTVLFHQFHDVMGGCSIYDACQDACSAFHYALHIARQITNQALQKIAWNIDTSCGFPVVREKLAFRLWTHGPSGAPLTIFNPHSWPLKVPVRTGADIHTAQGVPAIQDEAGAPVPYQRSRGPMINHDTDKWESIFLANIPPFGWRTYWLRNNGPVEEQTPAQPLIFSDTHLENAFISADFDPDTGALIRLNDKSKGCELLSAPARDLVIDETDSDTWGHKIFSFRNVIGEFSNAKTELVESGAVCAKLRITTHYNRSTIVKYVTLYRELPELYVSIKVFWNEQHRMLKLSFPTPFECGEVASIPYGHIRRTADGKEQPMQNWVCMGTLGIVTDTRTAYDALNGEIRITALRSPLYADHFAERDDFCEFTGQGEHRFQLILSPCSEPVSLSQRAAELTCPPEKFSGTYHEGPLKLTEQFIETEGDPVIIDTIKRSEDRSGWVIRLHEPNGRDAHAHISIAAINRSLDVSLSPYQICTFLFTATDIIETDFTEAALSDK